MANRLKEIGETGAWHLMVSAAVRGATEIGYSLKRRPGRGLSNTYDALKDGKSQTLSVRTTRDRYVAFPPLDEGTKWKTLDDVDLVLVSAVDDPDNPQNVDVYLFPADEVRKRFNAAYSARIGQGHTVRDNFGMWVMLDKGDDGVTNQIGHSLAVDYPAIARFTIDDLQESLNSEFRKKMTAVLDAAKSASEEDIAPVHDTVANVLAFAQHKIALLTGMPVEVVKLELKMGV